MPPEPPEPPIEPTVHTAPAHPSSTLRLPLFAMGALVVASVLLVAAVRWSGVSIHEPDAPARYTRSLLFEDRVDGGIDVIDAKSHTLVETIVGQAGFVRGTLRGLARERRREGIGAEVPFELIERTDGRLTLVDPATSRHVDLESFGPTNMNDFVRLLGDRPQSKATGN